MTTMAEIISVNVGLPREVVWDGKPVSTGIFKAPISERVAVRTLNLDGDRQADLSVHGGPEKAVYAYSAAHYPFWQAQVPDLAFPWGVFGENLTISDFAEDQVHIGDLFRIGTALLRVTQPRMPCFKLGIRFGRADMVKRFMQSERFGVYFAVVEQGELGAGDPVALLERDPQQLSVRAIGRLFSIDKHNTDLMHRAVAHPHLAAIWRKVLSERLSAAA